MSTPDKIPIKIGHIMPYPGIGGTELATLRMAKLTESSEIENHFLIPTSYSNVIDLFMNNGFPVHKIDVIEPSIRHFKKYYAESKKLALMINAIGIDILHASDMGAAFNNSLAAKLSKRPLLSHVRSLVDRISFRDKLFLLFVDRWIFVSKASRSGFAFKFSLPKSSVLYDCIDSPEITKEERIEVRQSVLKEFSLDSDVKLIGMVSRLSPQKDHKTLVDAICLINNVSDLKLKVMIIGHTDNDAEAEYFADLKKHVESAGLNDVFIYTGFRNDVARLMTALDLHVLSTHLEGFPLVNLEAMAKKTPVIATAISGIPEAINDGVNGFLVEHKNESDLAEKLNRLLSDKAFSLKIGEAGYEYVKENFSSDRFRERILDIYKKVLKK